MSRLFVERIVYFDQQIRAGLYPNADVLSAHWEVSRRIIFSDRKFLLERLGAPLAHDRVRGGWYYTEPNWALPSRMVTQGELLAFFLSVEIAHSNAGNALGEQLYENTFLEFVIPGFFEQKRIFSNQSVIIFTGF